MAREGETEIAAALGGEWAGIEEESSSREAFAIGELSQARELPPNGDRARERRRESSSERASRGEM